MSEPLKENNYVLIHVAGDVYALGTWMETKHEYKFGPVGTFEEINPLVFKLNEWHKWMMLGGAHEAQD